MHTEEALMAPLRVLVSFCTHAAVMRAFFNDLRVFLNTDLEPASTLEPAWPAKSLKTKDRVWRRGWDSNPTRPFGFCKLQILNCRPCRECQRCRGALHAVARWVSRSERSLVERDSLQGVRSEAYRLSQPWSHHRLFNGVCAP